MEPSQSNAGGGSQGTFPGPNNGAFQGGWTPYMFPYGPGQGYQPQGYQPPGPSNWPPQGYRPPGANGPMMHPNFYGPEGFQHPQTTQPYVQDNEADVHEVPPPTGTRRTKRTGRVKLGNFTPDEDKYLVKSWLEISCDPITSTGQKKERMWQRILERYNLKRGNNPERTARSLQSRWDSIRAECNVFAGHYADSIRENPSGMSDADKTTHAVGNFSDIQKRKFVYLHCWELLKDAPKWQDVGAREIAAAARGEGFGEDPIEGADTVEAPEVQASPVRSGAQSRRPMGRDSAKAAKKKANSDAASSSSAEYAAKFEDLSLKKMGILQDESARKSERWERLASIDERRFEEMQKNNQAKIQLEQERIHLMRAQHEEQRKDREAARRKAEKEEDERVLGIDLDACTPALRQYYSIYQQEILERQAARRRSEQS